MMLLANQRIEIDARPTPPAQRVLESVMLGHAPSRINGVRWDYVARDETILTQISALGFDQQVSRLRRMVRYAKLISRLAKEHRLNELLEGIALGLNNGEAVIEWLNANQLYKEVKESLTWIIEGRTALAIEEKSDRATIPERITTILELNNLYGLPVPIYSLGQFQVLFPNAFDTDTLYKSVLGGKRAWLPLAVQDFFENSSGSHTLKLWIIRVDETEKQSAFLPVSGANMIEPETLGAFERALLIPRAAIMALPDLERLQIPARLEEIPPLQLGNPEPVFLPCGTEVGDGRREWRNANEIPPMPDPLLSREIIVTIARAMAQHRPDMQCLLSVALAAIPGSERPGPDPEFLKCAADLAGIKEDGSLNDESRGRLTEAARHLQLLYPYLRGPDRKLGSSVGLVAGMQAAVSQQHGPWRSIGERPLPGRSLPWPPLNQNEATALRNRPGVTVLLYRAGRTVVDDERMCAPLLPAVQLLQLSSERRNDDHWRSAEIMRFMGWLRRELEALGEKMIFDVDPRDPRPEIVLRSFFTRLYTLGALRGRKLDEAFTLTQRNEGESTIAFEIEIAPAYPIDRLRITFMQDRNIAAATVEMGHG